MIEMLRYRYGLKKPQQYRSQAQDDKSATTTVRASDRLKEVASIQNITV